MTPASRQLVISSYLLHMVPVLRCVCMYILASLVLLTTSVQCVGYSGDGDPLAILVMNDPGLPSVVFILMTVDGKELCFCLLE